MTAQVERHGVSTSGGEHATCATPGMAGLTPTVEQHDGWAARVAVMVDSQ